MPGIRLIASFVCGVFLTPFLFGGIPSRVHVFPQVGDGGGLRSTFLILNQNSNAESITLSFFQDDGTPWVLTIQSATTSVFSTSVPANGMLKLVTGGAAQTPQTGWAQLKATGEVGAQVLFEIFSGATLVTQAAVESSSPIRVADLFVEQASNTGTGIAVANLSSVGSVRIRFNLMDENGNLVDTADKTLGSLGHFALFVGDLFEGLGDMRGTLNVSSSGPVGITTLQVTGLILGTLPPVRKVL